MAAKVAKAPVLKLITGNDNLQKESLAIIKAVGNLDKRIQTFLISELSHINEHSNTTRLNDFIKSLQGKGTRVAAIVEYVQKYGNLSVDQESNKLKLDRTKSFNLEGAMAEMWTACKPENRKLTPFNLNAELAKIVNKAVDLSTNRRENVNDEIPDTTIQKLLELAAQLGLKIDTPEVKAVAANDEGKGAQAKEAA